MLLVAVSLYLRRRTMRHIPVTAICLMRMSSWRNPNKDKPHFLGSIGAIINVTNRR